MSAKRNGYRPSEDAAQKAAAAAVPQPPVKIEPYWRIPEWFKDLTPAQLNNLRYFHLELIRVNQTLNLFSNRDEIDSDSLHIADCIMGARVVLSSTQAQQIHEYGCGNGLPGIVLAALDPTRKIVICERDERRIDFIKTVIARLQLSNVSIFTNKFDELPDGTVQAIVSRGAVNISKAILMVRKSCAMGAEYFHFKNEGWVREVADIPTQICAFWAPRLAKEYKLPVGSNQTAIIVTKKIG